MDPRLATIVKEVQRSQYQMNPGDELVDGSMLLQLQLLQEGHQSSFTEDDLFRALEMLGVREEDRISWFESFASWV